MHRYGLLDFYMVLFSISGLLHSKLFVDFSNTICLEAILYINGVYPTVWVIL